MFKFFSNNSKKKPIFAVRFFKKGGVVLRDKYCEGLEKKSKINLAVWKKILPLQPQSKRWVVITGSSSEKV